MAGNTLHDLAAIVADLDAGGRLARVRGAVDVRHELAGVAAKLEGGPRAVLFETVKGRRWPVLAGLYWNRGLVAELVRRDERALAQFIAGCVDASERDPAGPEIVGSGPVLDVTESDVDLGGIPVPVHTLEDAGPCIEAAVAIAKDPESGERFASLQRCLVAGRDTLHVCIDADSRLAAFLGRAKRMGRSLWITLNCGVGPGLHIAAAMPAEAVPGGRDTFGIASALQGGPLELVPGTESDVEMAAHAMWALECEMIPGEYGQEGPLAAPSGCHAPAAPRPVARVRRIHRRAEPVFQTILPGAEACHSIGLAGEANALALLRRQVPGVRDVHFTQGGAGHAVVQIAQQRAGWSKRAILAAFSVAPHLKIVTVVDDDVDPRNARDVDWAVTVRLNPSSGIVRIDNASGPFPDQIGAKVGFDATQPLPRRPEHERAAFKPVTIESYDVAGVEPARAGARPADHAAQAPSAAPAAGDYDTDRIWQRELGEWKKDRGCDEPPSTAAAQPKSGGDWDESRWWRREVEEMKRERAAETPAPPAPKKPISPAKPPPRPAAAARPAPAARHIETRAAADDEGGFFRGDTT
jgi:2,5-furandicarboxylate decarboxylase 1